MITIKRDGDYYNVKETKPTNVIHPIEIIRGEDTVSIYIWDDYIQVGIYDKKGNPHYYNINSDGLIPGMRDEPCINFTNDNLKPIKDLNSKKASELIPTNWLDPLLTGKNKIMSEPPYNCKDIEKLLFAIKQRIIDYENERQENISKKMF